MLIMLFQNFRELICYSLGKIPCLDKGRPQVIAALMDQMVRQAVIYGTLYCISCQKLFKFFINKGLWEIEESFKIIKSEFKARPVFVKTEDQFIWSCRVLLSHLL